MTPHMLLITSRGEVKRDQAAVICDREFLEALGHAGMDEAGEWAVANSRTLRAGLADARLHELAEQERERKLAESVRHIAECGGYSFCQGTQPCEDCPYAPPEADAAWLDACEGMSEPQPGDRCTWCNPAGCQWPQCTTAGDSRPTVAVRCMRPPTPLPTLPWWRRLALRWLGF